MSITIGIKKHKPLSNSSEFERRVFLYKRNDESKALQDIMSRITSFQSIPPKVDSDPYPDHQKTVRRSSRQAGPSDGWARRFKTGEICMTSMHAERYEAEHPVIKTEWTTKEYRAFGAPSYVTGWGGIYRPVGHGDRIVHKRTVYRSLAPDSPRLAHLLGEAMAKLPPDNTDQTALMTSVLAEANSAAYDLASELAEARETIAWIGSKFGDVRTALRNLAKSWKAMRNPGRELTRLSRYIRKHGHGKIGHIPDPLKKASSYWLEYTYAVKPLMYSFQDAIRASALSGMYFQKFSDRDIYEGTSEYHSKPHSVNVTRTTSTRVGVRQRINGDNFANKVQLWIPTAVWEILPYSFVIDWFVGIGDYIGALRPFNGEVQKMYLSIKDVTFVTIRHLEDLPTSGPIPNPGFPDYHQKWFQGFRIIEGKPINDTVYKARTETYTRVAPISPKIGIRIRDNFTDSLTRTISAVALLYQQLRP